MQLQQVTIGKNLTFDLYDQGVSAGNPQPPSGDYSEKIDLNKLLITNETATFFCRVSGRSMEPHMRAGDEGYDGDVEPVSEDLKVSPFVESCKWWRELV